MNEYERRADDVVRIFRMEKNAGVKAREARLSIAEMPDTHANLECVLDELQRKVSAQTWGDFSEVSECLDAAWVALGKVYAEEVK